MTTKMLDDKKWAMVEVDYGEHDLRKEVKEIRELYNPSQIIVTVDCDKGKKKYCAVIYIPAKDFRYKF
jgi:hypothetical protein